MEQWIRGSLVRHVLEHLESKCTMEEVVEVFPYLTRKEVRYAIDQLSRAGRIRLTHGADGVCYVQLAHFPAQAQPCAHTQLINDVLTPGGEMTGQLRCLECFAFVKNPSADPRDEGTSVVGHSVS